MAEGSRTSFCLFVLPVFRWDVPLRDYSSGLLHKLV